VGRADELSAVLRAVRDLRGGVGSAAWVEGEPGIGKSSLVAEALADCDATWNTGWGMADQLSGRLPLRVMLDCLQVRPGSPDARRAHAAELLRQRQLSSPDGGDTSAASVESWPRWSTSSARPRRPCWCSMTPSGRTRLR
jgi:hypothetical protein